MHKYLRIKIEFILFLTSVTIFQLALLKKFDFYNISAYINYYMNVTDVSLLLNNEKIIKITIYKYFKNFVFLFFPSGSKIYNIYFSFSCCNNKISFSCEEIKSQQRGSAI